MRRRAILALAVPLFLGGAVARAQIAPPEKPFAEHKLVLQISDDSESKQHQLLNNAENVMKAFGPDKVSIEVVAFGPGLGLLRADNPNAAHIHSLLVQGLRFDACQNTIDTIERNTGKPFPLNPDAQRVPSGVAQIMVLVEHGYTPVRP